MSKPKKRLHISPCPFCRNIWGVMTDGSFDDVVKVDELGTLERDHHVLQEHPLEVLKCVF